MVKQPSIFRTKKEKRARATEAAPAGGAGMSRRRFLTFLGTGSAALAAGSSGVLPEAARAQEGSSGAAGTGQSVSGSQAPTFFTPIEASGEDTVKVPEGYKYSIVRSAATPSVGTGSLATTTTLSRTSR